MLETGEATKVDSIPTDPSRAVAAAARELAGAAPMEVLHGTTIATNALLEGRLAPAGVLLNRGFRDLLVIGRQSRPEVHALEPRRAPLPFDPELVAEIPGRLGPGGVELEPLDPRAVRRGGERLRRAGARALAVVFLHSYADLRHEEKALRALRPLGLPLTSSARLNPEFREFERGLTAVINAGLMPLVSEHLERLESRLGRDVRVWIMSSAGGLLTVSEAAQEPARLLLSGPAAGLVGARSAARAAGVEGALLTLDMGGTSTDVALIPGELPAAASLSVGGLPVRLPSLDIHTIGAGGGSVAHADAGGALAVGPMSAGADPGPAVYGKGDLLTVTDAHLLLGHIHPDHFAGGDRDMDLGAAERLARRLAKRLGIAPRDLLGGIIRLADAAMGRALRLISMQRGHDPARDVLVAFGGAGGLHAAALARVLGMRRVLWPPQPGVLSARGLLEAPFARTKRVTVLREGLPSLKEARALAAPLVEELVAALRAAGFGRRRMSVETTLEARYQGQSYELDLPLAGGLEKRFHHLHRERFGFDAPHLQVELVALRCTVSVPAPALPFRRLPAAGGRSARPAARCRPIVGDQPARPVHLRRDLRAGQGIQGPALIMDATGTLLLDRKCRARVHASGALLVEVGS